MRVIACFSAMTSDKASHRLYLSSLSLTNVPLYKIGVDVNDNKNNNFKPTWFTFSSDIRPPALLALTRPSACLPMAAIIVAPSSYSSSPTLVSFPEGRGLETILVAPPRLWSVQ